MLLKIQLCFLEHGRKHSLYSILLELKICGVDAGTITRKKGGNQ